MEDMNDIKVVKFLRCPKCEGFTLESRGSRNQKKQVIYCKNCKLDFILKGNSVMNYGGEREEESQVPEEKSHEIRRKTNLPLYTVIIIFLIFTAAFFILKKKDY